jgi:hypothetical protein
MTLYCEETKKMCRIISTRDTKEIKNTYGTHLKILETNSYKQVKE